MKRVIASKASSPDIDDVKELIGEYKALSRELNSVRRRIIENHTSSDNVSDQNLVIETLNSAKSASAEIINCLDNILSIIEFPVEPYKFDD